MGEIFPNDPPVPLTEHEQKVRKPAKQEVAEPAPHVNVRGGTQLAPKKRVSNLPNGHFANWVGKK